MIKRILKNKLGLSGLLIVLFMSSLALLAPFIVKYEPISLNIEEALLPPGPEHLLGTDSLGRDLFSRIVYGARISLSVGFVAVGIAVIIGIILGSIAGFFGGIIDAVIMRFTDIMLCFPSFFLIVSLVALLAKPSIY
ncbi:MAG: peptide ABC transporter permease, partial [Candidatus Omnitrophota bacterium]